MSDHYDPIRIRVSETVAALGAVVDHANIASEVLRNPGKRSTDERVIAEALQEAHEAAQLTVAHASALVDLIASVRNGVNPEESETQEDQP